MIVSIIDSILRQINIIEVIFKCQFSTVDINNPFPYPQVLDLYSNSVDGRYIDNINIKTNTELLNIQNFKNHVTARWESANDKTLLINQLAEIHKEASLVVDFYNEKLTNKNPIVLNYINSRESGNLKNRSLNTRWKPLNLKRKIFKLKYRKRNEVFEYHSGVLIIKDYRIDQIYLGGGFNDFSIIRNYNFRYHTTNYELANTCQTILNFINKFGVKLNNGDYWPRAEEGFGEKTFIHTLGDAVYDSTAETKVYQILIEANLIDSETKIFSDQNGYGPGYFYSTIETFFIKGYFKRKLSKREYLNICNTTFQANISLATAKNNKTRAKGLSNIPSFI